MYPKIKWLLFSVLVWAFVFAPAAQPQSIAADPPPTPPPTPPTPVQDIHYTVTLTGEPYCATYFFAPTNTGTAQLVFPIHVDIFVPRTTIETVIVNIDDDTLPVEYFKIWQITGEDYYSHVADYHIAMGMTYGISSYTTVPFTTNTTSTFIDQDTVIASYTYGGSCSKTTWCDGHCSSKETPDDWWFFGGEVAPEEPLEPLPLNPGEADPVALFHNEYGHFFYAIDPVSGDGVLTLHITQEEIDAVGIPTDENVLIAEGINPINGYPITFWRLTTGEYQINSFYDDPFRGRIPFVMVWEEGGTPYYLPE